MKPGVTRLFDGGRLRADVFAPDAIAASDAPVLAGKRLLVTFRQRIAQDGAFSHAAPVRGFVEAGYTHLHLQARLNDWYVNDETAALCTALAGFTERFDDVAAMGFSMGGYAALRFSRPLRLARLIAVSPQVSIAPQVVPHDRRYRDCAAGFDPGLGDLTEHGRRSVRGLVLLDPFKRLDLMHGRMIREIFPQMRICRLAGAGHPASQVIGRAGRFGRLQWLLREDAASAGAVIGLHRGARRQAPHYWRQMADIAQRRGRADMATRLEARAAACAAGGP